ncbi:hypothetical protein EMIHUDRAFT_111411 [Emiliania huxleyi CCMP1516]|uniref:Cytochrome b5 heme-binding domain-containing protein n=2 Tax=Emiliania huxleyi TaxID=2903 RepID=A0A0D3JS45_EMIH1|nr:hypothetical protein EMIHUDRAFT_100420 [Emiliania huxleyi CCMP1516]XP_005786463.1 hypothetical protein EMIHUDRAFT_111411 [Emiliania huxleyi CCMP1516]EOD26330.1 hypothetical protein EMIHUDRAFT_100420 [Emiliania huxleyi CCMP1516]EOD34034.1 hypothetical protein EMIHUDRAFT_111411 [Emiliania huxleyi CCMP1516]|eukprot:XP_005778759.1 hypothetical protein EMIHUDRAFT_100420 [Emiliania huxleyi CCMP1516]
MVNMKASGHQGQRKRRQAGAEDAVTKLEKLKLRPDSLACVNPDGVPLRVVAREKVLGGESNAHLKAALVAPATLAALGAAPGSRAMLCRPGGDFILSARAVADVPVSEGEVLLGEAQRLSLHVCEDEFYEWVPYRPPADEPPLAALSVEAQLLHARPEGERLVQDAAVLGRQVGKWLFGEMVSDNEVFIVSVSGAQLVLRATGCLPQQAEDEDEDDEMGGGEDEGEGEGEGDSRVVHSSHCFRGLVGSRTRVYVGRSTVFASSASQRAVCEGLALVNVEAAPAEPPRNAVLVETSDGEVFPVHRRLLKPCITLTRAVRDESGSGEAVVDVDCSTFDRVLLFLEAANRGRPYEFDMQTLPQLAAAAAALGCRALREACARKLGAFEEHVVRHNDERGGCWVTMDGMVFDLEAWLPEHPGGATIIPQQALNADSTVFFELYHASRESFTYLKEFYIGELAPEDLAAVPRASEDTASSDFMQQLREFATPFRLRHPRPEDAVHKSF